MAGLENENYDISLAVLDLYSVRGKLFSANLIKNMENTAWTLLFRQLTR